MFNSRYFPTFAVLLILTAIVTDGAKAQEYTFAGIPWHARQSEITQKMQTAGFRFVGVDDDNDLVFSGTVLHEEVTIWAYLDVQGRLVRMSIMMDTAEPHVLVVYDRMKAQLIRKYGQPNYDEKTFDPPYYEGDGYEEQAIQLGKGNIATAWDGTSSLWMRISTSLKVYIHYESPFWEAEQQRRRDRSTRAF